MIFTGGTSCITNNDHISEKFDIFMSTRHIPDRHVFLTQQYHPYMYSVFINNYNIALIKKN